MTVATTELRDRVATTQREPKSVGEIGIAKFLDRMSPEIAKALPKHMTPDRMARIALTVVRKTPKLEGCTPASFAGALLTCSQLGLEPGATGEAYLIPYGNECTLVIGYRGMAKLFWQSPLAKGLDAQTVFANDDFEYELGLNPVLIHKPKMADRGVAIGWYAVARLSTGGTGFVFMGRDDIEKIRKRSKAKDDGPWKTDYDEMAKKTCLRRLFKLMPMSSEIGRAMAQDGTVRTDLDPIDVAPVDPVHDDDILDAETGDEPDLNPETGEIIPDGVGVRA